MCKCGNKHKIYVIKPIKTKIILYFKLLSPTERAFYIECSTLFDQNPKIFHMAK